ncbi:MAG: PIG-L family deacetylase [Ilumatobacteraceae bacterium]
MARASDEGHRVVLVVATDGMHGETPDDLAPGETLAERRRTETMASADALGIHRVEFLDYHDSRDDRVGRQRSRPCLRQRRSRQRKATPRRHRPRRTRRRADDLRLARWLRTSGSHPCPRGRMSGRGDAPR